MRFSKEDEAKLYYLYMMADGKVSQEEKKIFQRICMEFEIKADDRHAIIKEYEDLMEYEDLVFEAIEKLAEGLVEVPGRLGGNTASYVSSTINRQWKAYVDAKRGARMIWNLVNIGYADSVYSPAEKKIVNYLVEKLEVKPEVYKEFIDIADTMLALNKQRQWIQMAYTQENVIVKKENQIDQEMKLLADQIDQEMKLLADQVELTIQELEN